MLKERSQRASQREAAITARSPFARNLRRHPRLDVGRVFPKPKVHSSVIQLRFRRRLIAADEDISSTWFGGVRAATTLGSRSRFGRE